MHSPKEKEKTEKQNLNISGDSALDIKPSLPPNCVVRGRRRLIIGILQGIHKSMHFMGNLRNFQG
jgi:hypothetical protein